MQKLITVEEKFSVNPIVDTGSPKTIPDYKLIQMMGNDHLAHPTLKQGTLITADGSTLEVVAEINLRMKVNKRTGTRSVILVENLIKDFVVGMDTLLESETIINLRERTIGEDDESMEPIWPNTQTDDFYPRSKLKQLCGSKCNRKGMDIWCC